MFTFLRWGVVSTSTNHQAGGPHLVGCPRLLILLFNISAATLHIRGRSSIRNLRARRVMMTETHVSWRHPSYANVSRTTCFRHLVRFPGGLPSWKWLYGKTTLLQCHLLAVWRHRRSTLACRVVRYAVEWYYFMRDKLLPVASVEIAEGCFSCLIGSVPFMSAQFQFLNSRIYSLTCCKLLDVCRGHHSHSKSSWEVPEFTIWPLFPKLPHIMNWMKGDVYGNSWPPAEVMVKASECREQQSTSFDHFAFEI